MITESRQTLFFLGMQRNDTLPVTVNTLSHLSDLCRKMKHHHKPRPGLTEGEARDAIAALYEKGRSAKCGRVCVR